MITSGQQRRCSCGKQFVERNGSFGVNTQNEARGTTNLMPAIMEAVKAYATLGEIARAMRDVFGEYKEPVKF